MVSGSRGFGVDASNRQQTFFGKHEKAPVGPGGNDKAVVVQGTGGTRDGETAPIDSVGIPTREGRTSGRARKTAPTWLEEAPSRRDQGTGNGTEHLGPNGKPQVKEALIRDLLR